MREDFHKISMVLFIILVFGSVAVTGAAAKALGSVEEIKLTADTPVPNAQFGRSVALDGDLVAVGEGGDGSVGAVYLYRHQGMQYIPEATLLSPDAIPGTFPEFGRTVALQGNMVIVGARFAQVGDLEHPGLSMYSGSTGIRGSLRTRLSPPPLKTRIILAMLLPSRGTCLS